MRCCGGIELGHGGSCGIALIGIAEARCGNRFSLPSCRTRSAPCVRRAACLETGSWPGRVRPDSGMRLAIAMSMFAKISTYRDERSARLAGIGLMLLSIFMFSFGDALGKFIVATYSVGQLLWLRACAALIVLLPMIWRQRAEFIRLRAAVAAIAAGRALDPRSRGVFSRHRLSAARRRHHLLSGVSDLRHRAVGDRAARARRLAALERDPDRLLRRVDRAAAVGADGKLAGDDRARRQPVVCGADADHALVAGDARYRAGVVAVRRHVRCSAR